MSNFENAINKPCASVLLAGTVMVSCAGQAQAGQWEHWREFRQMNPGISGHALRALYRDKYDVTAGGQNNQNPPMNMLPIYATPEVSQVQAVPSLDNAGNANNLVRKLSNTRSFQIVEGKAVGMGSGADIDLGSSAQNIRLGNKLFNGADSVQIKVGDATKTLTVGSQVTAAEYVAAKQVLAGQGQKLELDGSGAAVGGAVDFASITFKNDRLKIDDLTIPTNVTAYGDFSKNPIFSVSGNLVNAGSVYAFSSGQHVRRSTFSADNVVNEAGGLITTDLPTVYSTASIANGSNAVDLNIRGNDTVSNLGTISSSGDLNISAGSLVENGAGAQLLARGDVSISAPKIDNRGLIHSINGDVTLDGVFNGELTVANEGGTVIAREGAINIRNSGYAGTYNTYVSGGDFFSKEVNVNAGRGSAEIDVDEMTGTLNQKGYASHVATDTSTLSLGNICLTGDPTYSNNGNISIDGNVAVGEALTIIAAGDITNSTGATLTANNSTQGFDVTIIAGAQITSGNGGNTNLPNVSMETATTISGSASGTGGNIIFGANGALNINTRSGGKTGNGGDVLLAAYRNGSSNGNITYTAGSITTGGKGAGSVNGDVSFIAGASAGTNAIANVDTTGGETGGSITFESAQPTSGGSITYGVNGSITAGTQLTAGSAVGTPAPLVVQGNLKAQTSISLTLTNGNLSWLPDSKFSITTLDANNGSVSLDANNIDVGNGNFFSTKNLSIQLGTGNLGAGGVVALQTNASNISAVGDSSVGGSEIVIVSYNKGLVLFSGEADIVNFGSTGTFMSTPGGTPITGNTVLIGSFGAGSGLNYLNPVMVDAANLFVTGTKKGDVFAYNTHGSTWTLLDTTTMVGKSTFSIQSDSNVAMLSTAVISAPNVVIDTSGSFSGLNGTINGSNSVLLSSNGNITTAAIPATINTPRLQLTSQGTIGTSTAARYSINQGVSGVTAIAEGGSVWLDQSNVVKSFSIIGGAANNDFDYTGNGSVTISGIIGSQNDTKIVISTGSITTKAATINSNEDILLQITDNVNTKNKIALGANTTLQTFASPGNGDIVLALGTPITAVPGTPPSKGVVSQQFSGGNIFWGNGVTGKGNNSVIAKAADVNFSNPFTSKNITLGGNVVIFADPPTGDMAAMAQVDSAPVAAAILAESGPSPTAAALGTMRLDSSSRSFGSAAQLATGAGENQPQLTSLDLSGVAFGAKQLTPSLNSVQQSQLNLITAEQATALDFDSTDDSVFISSAPSAQFHAGNLCIEDGLYDAITEGGAASNPVLKGVARTALRERVEATETGKTLFVPTHDMTVETQFGKLHIGGGAVVLVSTNRNGVAVYNIHDTSKESVAFDVRGQKMTICPGRHMLVSAGSGTDFASVNHIESVLHRGVSTTMVSDLKVHQSEFSTLSAITGVLPLRAIVESKSPSTRKIAARLLKTTAVLMHLGSGNPSDFQCFAKPRVTALR